LMRSASFASTTSPNPPPCPTRSGEVVPLPARKSLVKEDFQASDHFATGACRLAKWWQLGPEWRYHSSIMRILVPPDTDLNARMYFVKSRPQAHSYGAANASLGVWLIDHLRYDAPFRRTSYLGLSPRY
jgi:hypothetical protein